MGVDLLKHTLVNRSVAERVAAQTTDIVSLISRKKSDRQLWDHGCLAEGQSRATTACTRATLID